MHAKRGAKRLYGKTARKTNINWNIKRKALKKKMREERMDV